VRLTLRTLLAYLDDTLDPGEIRQIGQKVAESETAQQLIGRIKQITRRRRLTTPPNTGPGGERFDPNTVAEYLDNELPGDQVGEVEKACLESDVHLAEIASCHQILTLVLGEPALVPPTARERMYGLVRGKEAIPYRKASGITARPPSVASVGGAHDAEGDETLLMGLPFYRRQGTWLRWALPAASLLLVVGLGLALWMATATPSAGPDRVAPGTPVAGGPDGKAPEAGPDQPAPPKDQTAKGPEAPADKGTGAGAGATTTPPKEQGGKDGTGQPKEGSGGTPVAPPADAQLAERKEVGSYFAVGSQPSILVQRRQPEKEGQEPEPWRRLAPGAKISTGDDLVSLPGYLSEVRLADGVRLALRGHVREFSPFVEMDVLMETSVGLFNSPAWDLDLAFDRGRLYVSNHKDQGAAKVRLLIEGHRWELTLQEPGTEVYVELGRVYTADANWAGGAAPDTRVYLCVLRGKAGLRLQPPAGPAQEYPNLQAPPGPALVYWDNVQGLQNPARLEQVPTVWGEKAPTPPAADDKQRAEQFRGMGVALEDLSRRMVDQKAVDVALAEGLQSDKPEDRVLATYALGALDMIRKLLDVVGDTDDQHFRERDAAVFTLRRWISRGPEYGKMLYDPDRKGGPGGLLTVNHKYTAGDAATILELLHDYRPEQRQNADLFKHLAALCGASGQVVIRELAFWHLVRMAGGVALPAYNPGWPQEQRDKFASEIFKMVEARKLPPPQAPAGQPGAPGRTPSGPAKPAPGAPASGGAAPRPGGR
jgi:hypothetical protein